MSVANCSCTRGSRGGRSSPTICTTNMTRAIFFASSTFMNRLMPAKSRRRARKAWSRSICPRGRRARRGKLPLAASKRGVCRLHPKTGTGLLKFKSPVPVLGCKRLVLFLGFRRHLLQALSNPGLPLLPGHSSSGGGTEGIVRQRLERSIQGLPCFVQSGTGLPVFVGTGFFGQLRTVVHNHGAAAENIQVGR